jgi:hypothetical protein
MSRRGRTPAARGGRMRDATRLLGTALLSLVVCSWWCPGAGVGMAAAVTETAVPPALQANILVRILAYDRALKTRSGEAVNIGIVFKSSDQASTRSQEEMLGAFASVEPRTVQGLPLSAVGHPFKDRADLAAWAAKGKIGVLYVAPGLGDEIEAIREASKERKLLTVSPVRSWVERGLAVGVVLKGAKPGILVNLPASESAGADLDPKLLQLAEVLR